jgi:class 3 adenylate cyclase
VDISPIQYTWSGEFGIGYQTVGDGPVDLLYLPPWGSNLDWNWRWEHHARFLRRLGSFSRLILFDPRGWGTSDRYPPGGAASLEELVDDIVAVLETLNLASVAILASNESGFQGILAAAVHPTRVSSLVLFHCSPAYTRTDDLPWEETQGEVRSTIESIRRATSWDQWTRQLVRDQLPSHADDEPAMAWFAAMQRLTEGPGSSITHIEALMGADVRDALHRIKSPTLVMHRTGLGSGGWRIESSRHLAERIEGAMLVELPGRDQYIWGGDWEPAVAEIQRFLTGAVEAPERDIAVATVMFTDIVNSTAQAATLGDRRWSDIREQHDRLIRSALRQSHGREIDTAGDGFLATFAAPGQGLRCATAIVAGMRELGLEIRAGLHTGEVELDGDAVRGITVHIGARVSSLGGPNDVLVSQTVKDMLTGSGFTFEDAGEHDLKGVPDRWRIYRVVI